MTNKTFLALIFFILVSLFGVMANFAYAQSNRNPCIYLNTSNNNCQSVGSSTNGVGNSPMPVGGLATAAAPTFVEGMMGGLSFDLSGNLRVGGSFSPTGTQDVNLKQIGGSAVTAVTAGADTVSNTLTGLEVYARPSWFNGTTWDRALGDATNGAFVNVKTSVLPTGASSAANQILTQAPVAPATATATKSDLIGAQATSAAVNPTTGQQSALSSDLNNNLLVSSGGSPNLTTSQASVTTGNISVASVRALRRAITITNVTGTSAVYCGNTGVTTSTGTYLASSAGSSITLNTTAAIFCTVAATTQTVTVAETY